MENSMKMEYKKHHSSFRDPDGFVFTDKNNTVYRQLNQSYKEHYFNLMSSGLYDQLVKQNDLVSHQEVDEVIAEKTSHYKTLLPQQISFISYPYEWCFDQLRDAAILTLNILKQSLKHEMILKDATPFNIQFDKGKPIFIDTTSFEKYEEGKPWVAYRQFCQCFLAPLLLSHYLGSDLNKLFIVYPDGIPLKIVSKILPIRSYFKLSVLLHIHFQAGYKQQISTGKKYVMPKNRLLALIDNLDSLVKGLSYKNETVGWSNYYEKDVISKEYVEIKERIIEDVINKIEVKTALDIGANNGRFSQLLSKKNIEVVASDFDTACIADLYSNVKLTINTTIYPIVLDFAIPSPSIGWENNERLSFLNRAKFDLTLALAIIHHLAIERNVPLYKIAKTFSLIGKYLIIEFIPKSDPKVQLLLQNRKDVFIDYDEENFEKQFGLFYILKSKENVKGTDRIIYFFERRKDE